LEVKNPTLLPEEELRKKFIILDILAVDDRDRQYDIEMQVRQYGAYPERALYYLSKMYTGQLDSGQQYHTLKPVIGIHFLDYEQFPAQQAWQWAFALRDAHHPEVQLTDHLLLHMVELPKFERECQKQNWGEALFEWLHFLNHAHEEGEDTMQT
ncbi:MAG: Rpn family recombination-promoting nuclease/putative transposase, partial [bacterium]|nr:Rpn family recombination-promoting nuclease/putative transposase [bacterium]